MSNPRLSSALVVGLSALLLSGCGSSASPGVAASVGDETISASRVNDVTGHLCTAFADQLEADVPLGRVRSFALRFLVLREQTDQIAEEYGVSPAAVYERAVAENTRAASAMPEEVRADFIEVMSAEALAADVVEQVGRAKLAAEGIAEPTVEQVTQAGADVFATWPDANGIEVDPKYGIAFRDGQLAPVDTNLSFAVSDEAQAGMVGMTGEPDPAAANAYADSLPSSQRCG